MGQQASATGQLGQSPATDANDAFRHFRNATGDLAPNNANNANTNHNSHENSNAFMSTVNNGSQAISGNLSALQTMSVPTPSSVMTSCLYTDVTRPNGSPMDRAAPMDRELGRPGNRDSFSSHNLNQPPPYVAPPPPAKAEASTMMSTAFLQRNCSQPEVTEERHGGIVQYKIDTVHEECQVSESYTECPRENRETSAVEREVQMLEEKLRCAKEKAAEEESRKKAHSKGQQRNSSSVSNAGVGTSSYDEEAHPKSQHRNSSGRDSNVGTAVGTATYDEVPQVPFGMVTSDEPIMVLPEMYQHKETPQKAAAPAASPSRQLSSDLINSRTSAFSCQESHLTSISQQRPQPTPAPSTVGSCAPRQLSVAEELEARKNWSVGEVVEVFSSSVAKWYIGQVVQVGEKATAHMVAVQFVADNGQIMQKSMPRSDVQLATFGRNTRQMPPGFQKVASESRPGQFSYQDSSSGQKYQTKELAWQNYYSAILKSEQAQQLLRQQSLVAAPSPEATAAERLAAEKLKPASLQAAPTMSLTPTPTTKVSKAESVASFSSDLYAGAHGPDPVLAQSFQPANAATPAHHHASHPIRAKDLYAATGGYDDTYEARPRTVCDGGSNAGVVVGGVAASQRASYSVISTVSDSRSEATTAAPQSSVPKSKTPFPGYGQSFAIGTNAGYEAYLASQGMS